MRRSRSRALALAALLAVPSAAAAQRTELPAGQGGSLPLTDVMLVAKAYPNLLTEIRLRLIAAGRKKEAVACTARRLPNTWPELSGRRLAPYVCPIGPRTLTIDTTQTYYDRNGYRLKSSDLELARKATRLSESRLTWRWN